MSRLLSRSIPDANLLHNLNAAEPRSRASILLGSADESAMHASHDFNSRRAYDNRVDVGELILDRGRPTGDIDPRSDEPRPPHPRLRCRRGRFAIVALSLLTFVLACVLGALLVIPLAWREQAIAGSILIAGA